MDFKEYIQKIETETGVPQDEIIIKIEEIKTMVKNKGQEISDEGAAFIVLKQLTKGTNKFITINSENNSEDKLISLEQYLKDKSIDYHKDVIY